MDDTLKEKVKRKLQEDTLHPLDEKELKEQVKQRLYEEHADELLSRELPRIEEEEEKPEVIWSMGFRRVSVAVLAQYFRELSVLLQAGFPLLRALRVVGHGRSNKLMSAALTKIAKEVENGIALWRALEQHPRIFPAIVVSTIRAGESSGTLEEALVHLSDSLEYEADVRAKVRSAFDYPIFFSFLTMSVLVFMFLVVLPQFQLIYAQISPGKSIESPYFALLVTIKGYVPWVLWLGGSTVVLLWLALRSRRFMLLEKMKLRAPIFGRLLLLSDLTRFAKTLSVQAQSSIPILESLRLCRLVVDNRELQELVGEIETNVEEGGSLSEPFHKNPLIPRSMVDLMEVGEESGSLAITMEHLSKMFQSRIENIISRLTALLQPFLLLMMGGVVVLVFVGMLTPYLEILDRIQSSGFEQNSRVVSPEKRALDKPKAKPKKRKASWLQQWRKRRKAAKKKPQKPVVRIVPKARPKPTSRPTNVREK